LLGRISDVETGKHYNYFRDYDAAIGRYSQSDPIGLDGGINTYVYADDSPVRQVDPLGLASNCPNCSLIDCMANCIRRYDPLDNFQKGVFTAGGGTFPKGFGGYRRGFGPTSNLTTVPRAIAHAGGGGPSGGAATFARGVGRFFSPIWISYGLGMAALEVYCLTACTGDNCLF
jgi:RHS repeat-associated protein